MYKGKHASNRVISVLFIDRFAPCTPTLWIEQVQNECLQARSVLLFWVLL